jgi:mRNA interferase MazF
MREAARGEVWLVDLGIAAKVRPCLLLTDYPEDDELALITLLPHTTALRGNQWELSIPKSFLKPGAFHLQQIQSTSVAHLVRRLGTLDGEEFSLIQNKLANAFRFLHPHKKRVGSLFFAL